MSQQSKEKLEQLEALLLLMTTVDMRMIAPSSRASLLTLAHRLASEAIGPTTSDKE
ncbi:hypothetical protein ACMHYO_16060 [Allopusillimonas ginsengisoli]|uniref:hypothetical protein n=1 Tax=Allopusillimonas ginsengisoli TaxID=453575 RepID=UPI0039C1ACFE